MRICPLCDLELWDHAFRTLALHLLTNHGATIEAVDGLMVALDTLRALNDRLVANATIECNTAYPISQEK